MTTIQNICFIGAGQVGGTLAAVIAARHPDVKVHVVDIEEDRINQWQNDNDLPVKEPYLLPIVQKGRDAVDGRHWRNLVFSTETEKAIHDAEMIFITSSPTSFPIKTASENNRQHLRATITHHLREIMTMIASNSATQKIIIIKSTLPGGAAIELEYMLNNHWPQGVGVDVLYNPEFCAEGEAISNILDPDRIIIGSGARGHQAVKLLRSIYSWVPDNRLLLMDFQSAELAKLAANTMLAQRVSNVNALSALCEKTGADVEMVAYACGLDRRIGRHMLRASPGFGGPCLKKDIAILSGYSESLGFDQIGSYWKSIDDINEANKIRFTHNVIRDMRAKNVDPRIGDQTIAVLGYAFKKDTGDVRNSPTIDIMEKLFEHGYHLRAFDPQVIPIRLVQNFDWAKHEHQPYLSAEKLTFWSSALEACGGASAVLIATDWDEFSNRRSSPLSDKKVVDDDDLRLKLLNVTKDQKPQTERLDWLQISKVMRAPRMVFDGHNIMDALKLTTLGFEVYQNGKPNTNYDNRQEVHGEGRSLTVLAEAASRERHTSA